MIIYKIVDSPQGLFCALFESFTLKEKPIAVYSKAFQPYFDCRVKQIDISLPNAERVRKGIIKSGGISLLNDALYVLRSDDELKETIVFNVLYKCLSARKNMLDNFSDPDILAFYDLKSKIANEAHLMLGFLRFSKTQNQIYYAEFRPSNDVLELICPHFKRRFKNEKFIIHDTKRNLMGAYNGKELIIFKSDYPITIHLDKEEIEFQNLWKNYFNSVNISGRKNLKQQDNYLPRRYRADMVEFFGNLNAPFFKGADDDFDD